MSNTKTPSRRGGGAKKSIARKDSKNGQQQPTGKASDTQAWPHLKYEFLQKDKIRDNKKRLSSHPDYDPKTVYVPPDFLEKQTPVWHYCLINILN